MSTTSTTPHVPGAVTMLGLGAMGSALAAGLLDAGCRVTAWNRTPGRATTLRERGARVAETVTEAVGAGPLVVVCLLDHPSIHETLDPVAGELRGRTLINLTSTTPNEAREVAGWAARHDIAYLDGAVLAVPSMIGTPAAQIFYSGSREVYERHHDLLGVWATSTFDGPDAGMASLIDMAMLSGMYQMFAGFLHGTAMVGSAGMRAAEFTARTTPFLTAMIGELAEYATVVDGGDYTVPGQQSLEFSDLSPIVRASDEQGVDPAPIASVQALISRQIAAGHGSEGFARIIESMRAKPGDRAA